jgi:hypothetical protein
MHVPRKVKTTGQSSNLSARFLPSNVYSWLPCGPDTITKLILAPK